MGREMWMVHTCSKVFLALLFVYPPCHCCTLQCFIYHSSHIVICRVRNQDKSEIHPSHCLKHFSITLSWLFRIIPCCPTPLGHLMSSQSFKLAGYMSLPSSPHQSKSISLACFNGPTTRMLVVLRSPKTRFSCCSISIALATSCKKCSVCGFSMAVAAKVASAGREGSHSITTVFRWGTRGDSPSAWH